MDFQATNAGSKFLTVAMVTFFLAILVISVLGILWLTAAPLVTLRWDELIQYRW